MSSGANAPGLVCPSCGGEMIKGDLAIPILGSARFSYRVGTSRVETELESLMCAGCGGVTFRAQDPERIRRAHNALRRLGGRS